MIVSNDFSALFTTNATEFSNISIFSNIYTKFLTESTKVPPCLENTCTSVTTKIIFIYPIFSMSFKIEDELAIS